MPAPTGRGNGLPASSWTPVADLDPRLADAMLEALREAGIAAYAAPSCGEQGAYLEVRLPSRPADRLFVDTTASAGARDVLLAQLPRLQAALDEQARAAARAAPGTPVDEQTWAELIAAFEGSPAESGPVPSWPVLEDVDDEPASRGGRVLRPAAPTSWSELAGDRHDDASSLGVPAEDPTDHYTPPEPPPLPEGDTVSRLAWVGVVGGPAFLLLALLLGWQLDVWQPVAALLAFIAGFLTLVVRMRDRPADGDGPDDGAVV